MAKVVYSSRVKMRVPFPINAQDEAIGALNAHHGNSTPLEASNARTKFLASHYQIVQIDVLEDGSRVMHSSVFPGVRQ